MAAESAEHGGEAAQAPIGANEEEEEEEGEEFCGMEVDESGGCCEVGSGTAPSPSPASTAVLAKAHLQRQQRSRGPPRHHLPRQTAALVLARAQRRVRVGVKGEKAAVA